MKSTTRVLGALALAGLALTGCATADQSPSTSATDTSSPSSLPTASAPTTEETTEPEAAASTSTGQAWADAKVEQWWEAEGAEDFSEFLHPFNLVESWESPAAGELEFHIDPAITDTDQIYLKNEGPANDRCGDVGAVRQAGQRRRPGIHHGPHQWRRAYGNLHS